MPHIYGQNSNTITQKDHRLDKHYKPTSLEEAHAICLLKAKNGDAKAMYDAGVHYRFGMGTAIDLTRAFEFILRAADNGNQDALYMLGEMYKDGIGIKQDYTTAFAIFSKKALRSDYRANATLAYMLYKGLGCKQNYAAAYNLFVTEAENGNTSCMYYVGLCLKNGYGTTQNIKEANKWLKKSADKGDKQSISELAEKEPENKWPATHYDKNSFIKSYNKYQTIEHRLNLDSLDSIDGNYSGILYKYDWSGNYVIEQNAVKLNLAHTEAGLQGTLQEDGETFALKATIGADGLRFTNSIYRKIDRYSGGKPEEWEITGAQLQRIQERDSIYIVGNISMYSNDRREPSKPYLLKITYAIPKDTSKQVVDTGKLAKQPQITPTQANFTKRPTEKVARYTVQGDSVEIRLFDDGVIDGDEVSIIYNNEKIASKVALKASPYIIKIPIIKGQINRFTIFADNLGKIPPATAFLRIVYDKKEAALYISSDFSKSDSIEFVSSSDHL
ncbi:tetratricopeptide repeat protein [Parasediminibacterium paludis]|uniref:Tetratricopeptide repeat protein n=1 Tax=Parasediminibacterium paludis TaxID=908966 RepID=A0ABV8PWH3_9BACT